MKRILVVIGTRPEAIKLCPVVLELRRSGHLEPVVVCSAQHGGVLGRVLDWFEVNPDVVLEPILEGAKSDSERLTSVTSHVARGVGAAISRMGPDMVIVQGDTTTAFAGALAAFYGKVPVAHLEAGLRSGDRFSPYPEEMNRRLTSRLADVHLAPTKSAMNDLLSEGVHRGAIHVTGNTVIDALDWTLARPMPPSPLLHQLEREKRRVLLVTVHRRESWGDKLLGIARALADLARAEPDLLTILPMHPNPDVRASLMPAIEGVENIVTTEPLPYEVFTRLMARAHIILTDSGGVQEEAPKLAKPVLVMRDTTERPEAVRAGVAKLVGTRPESIVTETRSLLNDVGVYRAMAKGVSPYGDGLASGRVRMVIEHVLTGAPAPDQFAPRDLPWMSAKP